MVELVLTRQELFKAVVEYAERKTGLDSSETNQIFLIDGGKGGVRINLTVRPQNGSLDGGKTKAEVEITSDQSVESRPGESSENTAEAASEPGGPG